MLFLFIFSWYSTTVISYSRAMQYLAILHANECLLNCLYNFSEVISTLLYVTMFLWQITRAIYWRTAERQNNFHSLIFIPETITTHFMIENPILVWETEVYYLDHTDPLLLPLTLLLVLHTCNNTDSNKLVILYNYHHNTKLYRKISRVCCRLYCYKCAARVTMPMATNEWYFFRYSLVPWW